MEFDEDEEYSANSELRYLTLELMKIAISEHKTFKEVVHEFIDNVFYLKNVISKKQPFPERGKK